MKREHIWAHHEQDANNFWKLAEGGYAWPLSTRAGEEVRFHISNSRSYYDIHIFREGARRELVHVINDLRGKLQPVSELGYQNGFDWKESAAFTIPHDWKSGVYIAAFPTAQGPREILFVVRPPEPRAPLLLTIAANTYCAYNNVGGKCFYDYISTKNQHAKLLSFQRPLQPDMVANFAGWDQFWTSWLDAEEYEVDYCINGDHDAEPELLQNYRANLRIGHDEYNSVNECKQLQQFVRDGGNLLLFSGNAFCHEVELCNDGRQIDCAKPNYHNRPTSEKPDTSFLQFKDNIRQRTIGVSYTSFVHTKTATPGKFLASTEGEFGFYRAMQPEHWIFDDTSLKFNEEFGRDDSIVGVEADAADLEWRDDRPFYTGRDGVSTEYSILAIADTAGAIFQPDENTPLRAPIGEADSYGTIAINETEFSGTIFNAATIEWGHGLYRDNSVVPQITRNVLNRLAR